MLYAHEDQLLTRKQLHEIPIPDRPMTEKSYWKGINHGDLADEIINYAQKLQLNVIKEGWYTAHDHSAMFGVVDLDLAGSNTGWDLSEATGIPATFSLGVRHDNLGRYAVSFAVGGTVGVCSNGIFSGDFVLKFRHTNRVDLSSAVADGFEVYLQELDNLSGFVTMMRDTPINDKDASYLIMESVYRVGGKGFMAWNHLRDVWENWKNPPHTEFTPRTQFSLYNAYTEAAKSITLIRQMQTLKGLKPMMCDFNQADLLSNGGLDLLQSSILAETQTPASTW